MGVIIPIQLATPVQLQMRQATDRIPAKLIGLEHSKFMILSVATMSSSDQKDLFVQGKTVVARYIHEGSALGFETTIMGLSLTPLRLLFLNYPEKMEDMNLRKHQRRDCYLPAELMVGDKTAGGFILDISMGGSCFTCKSLLIFEVDDMEIGKKATLKVGIPGVEGKLSLEGLIRNIRTGAEGCFFGLQFAALTPDVQQRLRTYLEEMQMIEKQ